MTNMGFANPFPKNHCVPIAFTHAAHGDVGMAQGLAKKALKAGRLDKYGAAAGMVENAGWWAEQVGLRVTKVVRYRRLNPHYSRHERWGGEWKGVRHLKSVRRWMSNHTKGIYVVRVRGHAFAVVDGVAYGYWKSMSRILTTIRLEPIT